MYGNGRRPSKHFKRMLFVGLELVALLWCNTSSTFAADPSQKDAEGVTAARQRLQQELVKCVQRANNFEAREDFAHAVEERQASLDLLLRLYGPDYWFVANTRIALEDDKQRSRMTAQQRKELHDCIQLKAEVDRLARDRQLSDAATAAQQLIERYRVMVGEHHSDYANSLNTLASIYCAQGDYARAERFYRQALETKKLLFGEQNPYFADCLDNFAQMYCLMGDYPRAEPFYLKALTIRKSTLGEGNPVYVANLNGLGAAYKEMGDHEKAEEAYLQAVQIQISLVGKNHPDVAIGRNRSQVGV